MTIEITPPTFKLKINDGSDRIHPLLPKFPIFWANVGPRKSGKTVAVYSLLQKKLGYYGAVFKKENIIIYSPMLQFDDTLSDLKLPHMYSKETPIDLLLSSVVEQQRKWKEQDDLDHVLVVLDDITQVRDAWKHLEMQGYIGRHYFIHFLYIAHKMSSIPRGVRTQTSQWSLFKPHEGSELQWILDLFSNKFSRDVWHNALQRAWSVKYGFAFINFEEEEFDKIYRNKFESPLFTVEERGIVDGTGGTKFLNPNVSEESEDRVEAVGAWRADQESTEPSAATSPKKKKRRRGQ